ncbi:PspA/IM30 family protein [Gorillibacterium timonense]|uniref:PspA/IM30 family protein n=1 Tax=Gorillibacterium timonense TaxID=1689269 RepID=UPI00071D208E|nr:PspA/IM30 family protein [Gorillibacterium timonense]
MGILARFKAIMASNVNAALDKVNDPEKEIAAYLRSLTGDLGQVKAETASVLADEQRARRVLDECRAETAKLQRYADKSAAEGRAEEARRFLERKETAEAKERELQAAYDQAAENAANMKQLHDKLSTDIGSLTERLEKLKGKAAAAKVQRERNAIGSPMGNADSRLKELEDKVNFEYDEAMAIAELRAGRKDDLDEELERLDRESSTDREARKNE